MFGAAAPSGGGMFGGDGSGGGGMFGMGFSFLRSHAPLMPMQQHKLPLKGPHCPRPKGPTLVQMVQI